MRLRAMSDIVSGYLEETKHNILAANNVPAGS